VKTFLVIFLILASSTSNAATMKVRLVEGNHVLQNSKTTIDINEKVDLQIQSTRITQEALSLMAYVPSDMSGKTEVVYCNLPISLLASMEIDPASLMMLIQNDSKNTIRIECYLNLSISKVANGKADTRLASATGLNIAAVSDEVLKQELEFEELMKKYSNLK
jgi:hypothetical protein